MVGDQGVGAGEAVGAVGEQADLGVEAFEAPVAESELDRGEHARLVFADRSGERDKRFELGSGGPRLPRFQALGGLVARDAVDPARAR